MNRSLFLSWHAILALGVVAGFVVWMTTAGLSPGRGPGYDRVFLIATGCGAFALFGVVVAHVLRKYAHKLGYSPEFRMRMPIEDLERAETGLNEIRRKVLGGTLIARGDIQSAANAVLKQHKVKKILRIQLEKGTRMGDPAWRVLAVPTFPLGKMFHWMHAHIFYGCAALVLVGLHGGLAMRLGMGGLLELLAGFVGLTGIVGGFFWATGPARLTERERDLTTEKAFALDRNLERKVQSAFESVDPSLHSNFSALQGLPKDFASRAHEIRTHIASSTPAAKGVNDLLALLGQQNAVRIELRALRRIRMRMHAWRVVHIPAAILLFVLVIAHVVSVWRY
ncbi:MAG: hypothetical protein ACI8TQ_000840 [Planctomycetota bacterium]|jgi:hypothetical protein